MIIVYILFAIAAGSMLPLQGAMNARLARTLGSPLWAAAFSGFVLTLALTLIALATFRGGPRTTGLASLPWWAWAGGFGGALLLAATASLTPRLGAASLVSLIIAGQILCSVAMDKLGLLGFGGTSHQRQARDRSRAAPYRRRTHALADAPPRSHSACWLAT